MRKTVFRDAWPLGARKRSVFSPALALCSVLLLVAGEDLFITSFAVWVVVCVPPGLRFGVWDLMRAEEGGVRLRLVCGWA